MKTFLTSIVLITVILFTGCDKTLTTDEGSIKLSADAVQVMAGDEYEIKILSDGDYELEDENPEIASGWWVDEKTILIQTHDVGVARIWIRDRSDSRNDYAINVNSLYFHGTFYERIFGAPDDRIQITVIADDADIQSSIENDLYNLVSKRDYAIYKFDSENNNLIVDFSGCPKIENGQIFNGTYQWEPNGKLILQYDGITEEYGISKTPTNPLRFYLVQDEKEKYQQLYPDAKIYSVKATRIISAYSPI